MHMNIGQKLSGHLLDVRQNVAHNFVIVFKRNGKYENLQRSMFVNMDETANYFETKPARILYPKGCVSVAICGSAIIDYRLKACTAVAIDGSKLPLLVIFKGQPMKHI